MLRKVFILTAVLSTLLVGVAHVSAQPAVPRIQVPRIEGLPPEVQQEFDKIQQEIDQVFNQGFLQPNRVQPSSAMKWGGMQLKKVAADEQEKLGLPENEGLAIVAVDANSNAEKAGLKAKDVLIKVNNKAVPSDMSALPKFVKDQNAAEPFEIVVLRDGKEETIKNATMPAVVQMPTARPLPAFGGIQLRPMPLAIPGARINGRMPFQNGLMGRPQNLNLEMNVNGARIKKVQTGDDFTGEYSKDDLRITVAGKWDNGVNKIADITIQEGKDTAKYKLLNDVPVQHRPLVQQLLPATVNNFLFPFELLRDLQNFPGFPGIDN